MIEKLGQITPETWDSLGNGGGVLMSARKTNAGENPPSSLRNTLAMQNKDQMGLGGASGIGSRMSGFLNLAPIEKGDMQNIYNNLVAIMQQTTEHHDKLSVSG
jgi:hypothetical protein